MKTLALSCLALILWKSPAGAEFVLRQAEGRGGNLTVSTDQPTGTSATGQALLPAGATIKVRGDGAFEIKMVTPVSLEQARVKGSWSRALIEKGGYRLQVARSSEEFPVPIEFAVVDAAAHEALKSGSASLGSLPSLVASLELDPAVRSYLASQAREAAAAFERGDLPAARSGVAAFLSDLDDDRPAITGPAADLLRAYANNLLGTLE